MTSIRRIRARHLITTLAGVGLGILVSTGTSLANPVEDGTVKALNQLPFVAAAGVATPAEESLLVSLWGEYGLDQPFLLYRDTRAFIDSSFTRLKKYMLASQRPGRGLDYGTQARFRTIGGVADRIAMCATLRGWLEAPDSLLRTSAWDRVVAPPEAVVETIERSRCRAADMLADWGDSASLASVRFDPRSPMASRVCAEKALDRLRHPVEYGFILPDGHGGVRFTRGRAALQSMTLHHSRATPECPDTVMGSRVDDLWRLLHRSREGKHASWFNDGFGLHLVFKDGLVAELRPTESGWIEYSDSVRGLLRGRMVLEAPDLYAAVKDCLPERTLPR